MRKLIPFFIFLVLFLSSCDVLRSPTLEEDVLSEDTISGGQTYQEQVYEFAVLDDARASETWGHAMTLDDIVEWGASYPISSYDAME